MASTLKRVVTAPRPYRRWVWFLAGAASGVATFAVFDRVSNPSWWMKAGWNITKMFFFKPSDSSEDSETSSQSLIKKKWEDAVGSSPVAVDSDERLSRK
jgi:hypothetical protein